MIYSSEDKKLAIQLLEHSVEIQENESIMLQLIGISGIGLLRARTDEVEKRKAHPYLKVEDPEINRILLESGDEAFWEKQARLDQPPLMKHMDACIGIRGAEDIYGNSKV